MSAPRGDQAGSALRVPGTPPFLSECLHLPDGVTVHSPGKKASPERGGGRARQGDRHLTGEWSLLRTFLSLSRQASCPGIQTFSHGQVRSPKGLPL